MHLKEGFRLGPYEILAPLGAGGMGEVYRARDTRLGRTVAIKVLVPELSRDEKFRRRFEREAKAISSLQDPHICALYDVGTVPAGRELAAGVHPEASDLHYLVIQYLAGETLAARLRKGPLPIDQVLRYGIDIAHALDTAHRQNILHRDLKPANIMLTKGGACLLDFGLSKSLRDRKDPPPPTLSAGSGSTPEKPLTAERTVIGTIDYVAPELLEGKEADERSDVFSLGVCLYQMATGRRPFQGDSQASLMAAILQHDPAPISRHAPDCPPELDWLVAVCLVKDPDERMQAAHDVQLELKRIADTRSQPSGRRRDRLWSTLSLAAVAVLLLAGTSWLVLQTRWSGRPVPAPRRLSISLPASAPIAMGSFEKLAVSPDGSRVVYAGGREPTRLYVHSMETRETTVVPGTQGGRGPFFSPDGEWIGFYTAEGALKKVSIHGGVPVPLSTDRNLRGAAWKADGDIVFGGLWAPLQKISATGGQARAVTSYDPLTNVRWPSALPDSEHILYTVSDFGGDYENARLAVLSLESGKSRNVLDGGTYGRYVETGHLLYLHSETIYSVPFDAGAMKVMGAAMPVITDVDSYFSQGLAHIAVSRDGSVFYISRDAAEGDGELVWVDRSGKASPVSSTVRPYLGPRLSPDGRQVAVTVGWGPQSDLWLYDINRDSWSRLTHGSRNLTPVWSPDGKQIVFSSNRNRGFNLFIMPSDGSAPPRQITNARTWPFPSSWSPDGRTIAIIDQHRDTLTDIFTLSVGKLESTPVRQTKFDENEAAFSPDGKWIAYQSDESGRQEVYVQKYPASGPKWLVSTNGGMLPRWRQDGRELFYRNGNGVFAVDVKPAPDFEAGRPHLLFRGEFDDYYDVTPDGQRFVMVRRAKEASRTQINVVLGLFPPSGRAGTQP